MLRDYLDHAHQDLAVSVTIYLCSKFEVELYIYHWDVTLMILVLSC